MTDQKVVLITGASSGIGHATAELLTSRGYHVFGTARNPETVVPIQGVELLPLDVRDDGSVQAGVETALSRAGRAPHLPSASVTHRAARMRRRNRRTKSMVSRLSLLAVIGALALAGHARAADTQAVDTYFAITGAAPDGQAVAGWLCPLDARVVALGEGSAVVYHTYDAEGADVVRVVTTVATDPNGAAAPARFVSYLSPGQKAEVSVAGAVGTAPAVLELAYDGIYLAVRSVAAQPEG
jgi:NAD(P)-dependent dehydrogenase (short-subunit alcohol dehydrogenase family)